MQSIVQDPSDALIDELRLIASRDMDRLARVHALRLETAWDDYRYGQVDFAITRNVRVMDRLAKRLNAVHASGQRQLLRSARGKSQYADEFRG
jgi:hypothetical protein